MNYNNMSGELKYCRPMITYNGIDKEPIFQCNNLMPHNIEVIVRQSKMNDNPRRASAKLNLKYKIVEAFGGTKKPELMKELNKLEI